MENLRADIIGEKRCNVSFFTSLVIEREVGMVGQRDFDLPSPKIMIKDIHIMLLFLRDSGLEGVGLDLNISPPPDPPCMLCPCLQ